MNTKIVKANTQDTENYYLKEAADILSNGGLVIIPTETVYGIAANMSNAKALDRLYQIKQRPKDKPFSLHIEEKEKLKNFARDIPIAAYKLINKFWPGPLTLILKSRKNGTIGVRLPDNTIAQQIIALSGVSVVCPSANISGKPAPVNFQDAIKDLSGLVDFAIDAGNTRLGLESSVVDFTSTEPSILREGAIKKQDIEATIKKKNVLFVCTGNSCRSVMAEALLKKKLKELNRQDYEILSAGIMMFSGLSASEETKELLKKQGVDVSGHRSQRVTDEMLKGSDIILVMEKLHERRLLELAPDIKNRLFLLKEFAKIEDNNQMDILDPIGKSYEFYEEIFYTIKDAVERVADII